MNRTIRRAGVCLALVTFSSALLSYSRHHQVIQLAPAVAAAPPPAAQPRFQIEEASIASIHAAFKAGDLTCHDLVQRYLDRIAAYDKHGPAVNSIITINPKAIARAEELDAEFAKHGLTGPLHCIPVIVKDNFNTAGLETTAGSLALAGSIPSYDAFQVKKIREAGAVILAKANLSEFASSGVESVSSRLPGYTKNPYALDRVTAGSSGGTAAAVTANFGAVGLGSDTEDSIRGPAAHCSLVGIRSTMGLTSRAGIVPLDLDRDIGGPMARSVADAVAVLDVIAGPDPADSVTLSSRDKMPAQGYQQFLVKNGLQGARLGILRLMIDPEIADPELVRAFDQAVADLKAQGAEVIDPLPIAELDKSTALSALLKKENAMVWTRCSPFKFQLHDYLASLGPGAPVHSLDEIAKSGKYHPSVEWLISGAGAVTQEPHHDPYCEPVREGTRQLRNLLTKVVDEHKLDAFVYPSWSIPARLIGDLNTPDGLNSGRLASPTSYPSITVPMGYVHGSLPVGLEFLGLPWSDATLIKLSYSYEQATKHRRPPATAPPLAKNSVQ